MTKIIRANKKADSYRDRRNASLRCRPLPANRGKPWAAIISPGYLIASIPRMRKLAMPCPLHRLAGFPRFFSEALLRTGRILLTTSFVQHLVFCGLNLSCRRSFALNAIFRTHLVFFTNTLNQCPGMINCRHRCPFISIFHRPA